MSKQTLKPPIVKLFIIGAILSTSIYFLLSNQTNIKEQSLLPYIQSTNESSSNINNETIDNKISADNKAKHLAQHQHIQQQLYKDFENAFTKQYTPPIECINQENYDLSTECTKHLYEAKQIFRQEYIKIRGLPKNALDILQFSYKN